MLIALLSLNLILEISTLVYLIYKNKSTNETIENNESIEDWDSLDIQEFKKRIQELQEESMLELGTEVITNEDEVTFESKLGIS